MSGLRFFISTYPFRLINLSEKFQSLLYITVIKMMSALIVPGDQKNPLLIELGI